MQNKTALRLHIKLSREDLVAPEELIELRGDQLNRD